MPCLRQRMCRRVSDKRCGRGLVTGCGAAWLNACRRGARENGIACVKGGSTLPICSGGSAGSGRSGKSGGFGRSGRAGGSGRSGEEITPIESCVIPYLTYLTYQTYEPQSALADLTGRSRRCHRCDVELLDLHFDLLGRFDGRCRLIATGLRWCVCLGLGLDVYVLAATRL